MIVGFFDIKRNGGQKIGHGILGKIGSQKTVGMFRVQMDGFGRRLYGMFVHDPFDESAAADIRYQLGRTVQCNQGAFRINAAFESMRGVRAETQFF